MLSTTDLSVSQQEMITAFYEGNRLIIAQAGHGKTVAAQSAIQELIQDGILDRVVIFAPAKVVELTWADEYEQWEHLWPIDIANGAAPMRHHLCRDGGRIVVLTLDCMAWFFENDLHLYFQGMLIDEGSKVKDVGSKRFKKMRHKIRHFGWRAAMSATPLHESSTDIYAQCFFVDGGKALGKNKEKFLYKYFMSTDYKQYKWVFQPGGVERLAEAVKDVVFLADDTEYEATLPDVEDVMVPVKMPKEAWAQYDGMCEKLALELDTGEEVAAANLAVKVGKLQMIACGAVYTYGQAEPGEKKRPKYTNWLHTGKMDALHKIIAGSKESWIVVYQYEYELEAIRKAYPRAMVLADNPAVAKTMWNRGECKLLLVHPKSASHGVNLQAGGSRMVWLSPVWSADQWDQAIRRIRRRGQQADIVWRYILMVEGTVEPAILRRHTRKETAAKYFIQHIRDRQNAA